MADIGNPGAPFEGAWSSSTFYLRGSVVYVSTALYQARADTIGQSPTAGHPAWAVVTAVPLELYGTADATTGDGIPAALGSTYVRVGTGKFEKTNTTATDWAAGGGGGAISATDGTTTVNPATSIVFPAGTLSNLGGGSAGVGLITTLLGPFTVNFDDTDVNVNTILVGGVLPDGAIVIDAWATARDFADNLGAGPNIGIRVINSARTDGSDVTVYASTVAAGNTLPDLRAEVASVAAVTRSKVSADRTYWTGAPDLYLGVDVFTVGGGTSFVTGLLKIYAIIATPAA